MITRLCHFALNNLILVLSPCAFGDSNGRNCDYTKCSKHYRNETCKQLFEYDKCMAKFDKVCRGDMLYHSNLKGRICAELWVWTPYYYRTTLRANIWLKYCFRGQAQTRYDEMWAEKETKITSKEQIIAKKTTQQSKLWCLKLGRCRRFRFSSRSVNSTM